MTYKFQNLPQYVDKRGKLAENKRWRAPKRKTSLKKAQRAIHHSLTKKDLPGSTPEAFARYHVNTLDWPCIGYNIVITPRELVDTPNGKRAKIHYCVNLDIAPYHIGNSNDYAIGINIAGDYRYDKLDGPTMASFADLLNALDADNIAMSGMFSHHQFPGYAWKKCCMFSPSYAYENGRKEVKEVVVEPSVPEATPSVYTVQQGDTLYSIAHAEDFTADDLMTWNGIADPTTLKIGQKLKLYGKKTGKQQTPYTVGDWDTNVHGTQYIEAHGVFTVGSEPITMRNGSPKAGAPSPGKAQPGARIKYHEMVRVTFDYDKGEGYIAVGYFTGQGGLRYCYTGEWDPRTGVVSGEWGTFS